MVLIVILLLCFMHCSSLWNGGDERSTIVYCELREAELPFPCNFVSLSFVKHTHSGDSMLICGRPSRTANDASVAFELSPCCWLTSGLPVYQKSLRPGVDEGHG